jgi:hypothetical protein
MSFENFFEVPMNTTGFGGGDLEQDITTFRDIDRGTGRGSALLAGLLASA